MKRSVFSPDCDTRDVFLWPSKQPFTRFNARIKEKEAVTGNCGRARSQTISKPRHPVRNYIIGFWSQLLVCHFFFPHDWIWKIAIRLYFNLIAHDVQRWNFHVIPALIPLARNPPDTFALSSSYHMHVGSLSYLQQWLFGAGAELFNLNPSSDTDRMQKKIKKLYCSFSGSWPPLQNATGE